MYTLYVMPGSHACRSAMLMLEHKQVTYRRVDVVTLLHPLVARLHGFNSGGQARVVGERRPWPLRLGDRLGTVPALAAGDERISTNYQIARFLDERRPDPPLFPDDLQHRQAVEEAERWARHELARRLVTPHIGRVVFASGSTEQGLLAELPRMLDRIDAWIADGTLGGVQSNAADYMVAPSLALMLYRSDLRPLFEGRPALELVDRLLPEPRSGVPAPA